MKLRSSNKHKEETKKENIASDVSMSGDSSEEYEPEVEKKKRRSILKNEANTKKRICGSKKSEIVNKKPKNDVVEHGEGSSDGEDWEDVDLEDNILVVNLNGRTLDPADERKKRLAALKRKENFERKNFIKGEHVKEIVNVLEDLNKGYLAFKNGFGKSNKEIKKIIQLKGRNTKDKVNSFVSKCDEFIEELEKRFPIEIPCSNDLENDFKKCFYTFIALNFSGIECRVCSPCNPPSLLLNVKNLKFEGEKRYFFNEYFDKPSKKWTSFDVITKDINKLTAEAFNDPHIMYVFSVDFEGVIRDVIGRYTQSLIYHRFRQSRLPKEFMDETFKIYNEGPPNKYYDDIEREEMLNNLKEQGFPKHISDFKGHPLYCLDKDILQAEAVWPADTKSIGNVGKYLVYPRDSIKQLYTSVKLLMEGLDVKENEEPIKIVTRIPRASDRPDRVDPDKKPLYGIWQAKKYETPKLVDGKIEPNKYGNLYVFKPWMVPEECVHITQYTEYKKYADELEIQTVPAVVGFDTRGGNTFPVCHGFVVQKKDAKKLTDLLDKHKEKIQKARANRDKNRIKRLIERQINHANMLNPKQE